MEILGEAAKRIPPEVRDKYPTVPWREMAGIRDKLIHDYVNVNVEVVWTTVTEDCQACFREFSKSLTKQPKSVCENPGRSKKLTTTHPPRRGTIM